MSRSEFSYWSALRQVLPLGVSLRLLESGHWLFHFEVGQLAAKGGLLPF